MKKTKLMILVSSYMIGGCETKLDSFARGFDKNKFEISVLLIYPYYKVKENILKIKEQHRKHFSWNGVETIEMPMNNRFDIFLIFRAAKLIKEMDIDILYFMAFGAVTFLAPLAGKLARVPVIIRASDTIIDGLYPKILKGLDRWLLSFTNLIIVPSHYLKKLLLRELRVEGKKIVVIPNAIDVDKFNRRTVSNNIQTELALATDAKIIGIIANLVPIKAHHVLLNAIPQIIAKFPKTYFLLIGEGPLKTELEQLGARLNISENLKFLGFRADVEKIIPAFNIGLLCSDNEIHSISLMEIMAAGKPIVATNVGGIPEIVDDGKNGILVPRGDSSKLAQAIMKLLEDQNLEQRFGENAKKIVSEKFSVEKMLNLMEDIFNNMPEKYDSN